MKSRITLITLGVSDLDKSLIFYRDGMGLPTQGIVGTEFEDGAIVFFKMNGGLTLALWPKKSMAKEAKIKVGEPSPVEFCLAHNVSSREEVDSVIEQAEKAGARITDPPHDRIVGGYSGYFQDLDGHLWEIAWNPQFWNPQFEVKE